MTKKLPSAVKYAIAKPKEKVHLQSRAEKYTCKTERKQIKNPNDRFFLHFNMSAM